MEKNKINRVIILLGFLSFFSQPLLAKDSLSNTKTLKITSQHIHGIILCEKAVREMLNIIGYKSTFIKLPSARAISDANKGFFDGDVCRVECAEKKYKNLMMVTSPVTKLYSGVFVNKNLFKGKVTSWKDLENVSVATRLGHLHSENTSMKNVTKVASDESILKMLELGRVSASVMILKDALEIIKRSPKSFQNIAIANPYLSEKKVYFYIHKKNKFLLDKLNNASNKLKSNGFIDKAFKEYMAPYENLIKELSKPLK